VSQGKTWLLFLLLFDFNTNSNKTHLFVLFLNNKKSLAPNQGPVLFALAGYAMYSYLITNHNNAQATGH
jgi:hypothetical protein